MSTLPPVMRPNGKAYRPRKFRSVTGGGEGCGDPWWVLVLGTHDEALAREIAEGRAAEQGVDQLKPGRAGWWRQSIRNCEPYWEHDEAHGAAGIWFEEEA